MKNLDLNNYGVQEMNAGEMKAVEGGKWHWGAIFSFAGIGTVIGALVGGPVGAAIGAAAGGVLGGI
jgi:hypothetical protein